MKSPARPTGIGYRHVARSLLSGETFDTESKRKGMDHHDKELATRTHLVEAPHADLIGAFVPPGDPSGGGETLPLRPSRWYLTGFLACQGAQAPDVEDVDSREGFVASDSDNHADCPGDPRPQVKWPLRFPASMGLSAFLPKGSGEHETGNGARVDK